MITLYFYGHSRPKPSYTIYERHERTGAHFDADDDWRWRLAGTGMPVPRIDAASSAMNAHLFSPPHISRLLAAVTTILHFLALLLPLASLQYISLARWPRQAIPAYFL